MAGPGASDDDEDDDDVPQTLRVALVALEGPHYAHEAAPVIADAKAGERFHRETDRKISVSVDASAEQGSLFILTGPNAGQLFVLERPATILGRHPDADVWLEDSSVSRKHARIVRLDDENRYIIEDLKSANGTIVCGRNVNRGALAVGDRIQIGNVLLRFGMTDANEEVLRRRLYASSTRDPVTHAHNRVHFEDRLKAEVAYARRHKTALSLLVVDVLGVARATTPPRRPKPDASGSLGTDHDNRQLRLVAATVAAIVRTEDVFARYGGERFVVLVRAIGPASAALLGERLTRAVAAAAGEAVTLGIGIASLSELDAKAGALELVTTASARANGARTKR